MDEALLLWINQDWAHPALDLFFGWLSSRQGFALPLAALLLVLFTVRWRKAGFYLWLVTVLVVGSADLLGNILKYQFAQPRPCYAMADQVRLVNGQPCSENLSGMPSNHAINSFALAAFLTIVLRRSGWSMLLFLVAGLVALSRIYLAKHYPGQVAAGALIGILWGGISGWLGLKYCAFIRRFSKQDGPEKNNHDNH